MREIADAQCATRLNNLLTPGGGDEKEFQKGEIAGIKLFMQLPEIAIENLRQQLKEQRESQDEA